MLYMVTFTIDIPQVLGYILYTIHGSYGYRMGPPFDSVQLPYKWRKNGSFLVDISRFLEFMGVLSRFKNQETWLGDPILCLSSSQNKGITSMNRMMFIDYWYLWWYWNFFCMNGIYMILIDQHGTESNILPHFSNWILGLNGIRWGFNHQQTELDDEIKVYTYTHNSGISWVTMGYVTSNMMFGCDRQFPSLWPFESGKCCWKIHRNWG
jgi:hypothetical protein